jgi:hypothetical protein
MQIASHAPLASHAPVAHLNDQTSDLWSSVPEILRYVKVLHGVTDYLCRLLTPPEQVIYNQLYRLSWGFGKSHCRISLDKLAERANLSRRGAHDAVTKLIAKRLVVKQEQVIGKGKEQGTVFELPLPPKLAALLSHAGDARHAGDAYNKHILKETHTNTETNVRVGSRFNLKECRQYAEHLRSTGQGITNPGGYATKIHRSGEADELIAASLAHAEAAPGIDASKCPDCRGTGFWEPGGAGKGVAKCKHERLK